MSQDVTHVAVHLGVKMADTLSFTAKMDMDDFWVKCEVVYSITSLTANHVSYPQLTATTQLHKRQTSLLVYADEVHSGVYGLVIDKSKCRTNLWPTD